MNKKDETIIGAIAKYRCIYDVDMTELAAAACMGRETLWKRIKNPEKFTLKELRAIQRRLAIPKDEWLGIV